MSRKLKTFVFNPLRAENNRFKRGSLTSVYNYYIYGCMNNLHNHTLINHQRKLILKNKIANNS